VWQRCIPTKPSNPKGEAQSVKTPLGTESGQGQADRWPLSLPVLSWSADEQLLLGDCFTGVQVFGGTGSGKSSGPVQLITRAFMQHGFGMLCLTAKATDAADYMRMAREAGRQDDVVLVGPDHAASLNFVAEIAQGGTGLIGNLTALFATVSRLSLGGGDSGDRDGGSFWQKMDNRLIASSAELLVRAGEPLTTLHLERLVLGIPPSRAAVGEESWRSTSYVYKCLRLAEAAIASAEDREQVRRLADYFLLELAQLSEKTRSTVQTSVGATLDLFNQPVTRKLLSAAQPTLEMAMLQKGKIVICDVPTLVYGDIGRLIQMVVKLAFQAAQNRRDAQASPRPVALIADEAQLLIDLELDAAFQTTARATRTAVLYSTQSISNYLSQNGGASAEARTHALLANFQTMVFCNTSDTKTVEYAQSLFGRRQRLLLNGSTQQSNDDWVGRALGMGGSSSASAGFSESMDFLVQAHDFYGLSRGGPQSDWVVEGVLYQAGKTFTDTRKPFMLVRFLQQPPAK
jgi:hypothetical protein